MKIKSLSYSTMLHILSFTSNITDKGDYIVIKTPSNPHHHWGNFLMFPSAPENGDFKSWRTCFIKEFRDVPMIKHMAFAWDSIEGEAGVIEPFVEARYTFELDDVFMAEQLHRPLNYNSQITVRQIVNDEDWEKVCMLQIYCDGKEGDEDYRAFIFKRAQGYRDLTAVRQVISKKGIGNWFGAFIGNRLVASMGLYSGGGSIGLFQLVKTHPDYRRKGICGTLLFHASECGQKEMGFTTYVIVADKAYHAGKVYQSVGFEMTECGASLIHPLGNVILSTLDYADV